MSRPLAILATLVALAAAPAAAAEPDFVVVVHPATPVASLSRAQLSSCFLKKTTRWPDSSPVRPVEPLDPRLREAFARRVHQRSAAAIAAHWNALIFSGRDLPPLEKATDADVIDYVRTTPGAIGYVSAGADTTGVKALPPGS